jgi:hypothetical protein
MSLGKDHRGGKESGLPHFPDFNQRYFGLDSMLGTLSN